MLDPTDLERWRGATARLSSFSSTHDHLVIELRRPDGEQVRLVLSGCEDLRLPVFWTMVAPTLEPLLPPFVAFADVAANVRVCCLAVALCDDCT
jgi:hypothetical protein